MSFLKMFGIGVSKREDEVERGVGRGVELLGLEMDSELDLTPELVGNSGWRYVF